MATPPKSTRSTPPKAQAKPVSATPIVPMAEPAVSPPASSISPIAASPVVPPVSAPIASEIAEASVPPRPAVAENIAATTEKTASWPTPQMLEGKYVMNEAIEHSRKFAEDAKVRVQSMMVDFNGKAKTALEKSTKAVEEMNDLTKGNLEAIVESSKIAVKGLETIGQSAAEYGRSAFEKNSATFKSFASIKSPAEFFQLQSELISSTFDAMAAETAKNSEAMLKLAGDIAQPISNRVTVMSDRIKALSV